MTVLLIIGAVGVVLLVITLVLGDLLDGLLDAFGGGADWGVGALAGFLGAFGFGGALALSLSDSATVGIVAGVLAGLACGALAAALTRYLQRDQGGAVRSAGLVGLHGVVINAVPADGFGEVSLVVAGHPTKLHARSPEPLAPGTPVIIDAVLSPTSVRVVPQPS